MKTYKQKSIGRDAAIALADSKWWVGKSARDVVRVQLFTAECCMDFGVFQGLLEEVLGRPVFTHELGMNFDGVVQEFLGERDAPTLDEIVNLIPESKRILVSP